MRRAPSWPGATLWALLAPFAATQAGDREGEPQPPLPNDLDVPAARVLTPAEALAAFELAPGLAPGIAVELVACEPLVEDPVAIAFDAAGALWVCEMRGFMPDADGTGELDPVGVIAVLTDTDGDGRMDTRREFLPGLVLPRGVAPAFGGALVLAPPDLLFCRDTDGDGVADERIVVDTGFDAALSNPEHALNGFVFGHDGRFHLANHERAYYRDGERWTFAVETGGGQWGLAKDDVGRLYYDTNSDPLRGDRIAARYGARNPDHGVIAGLNVRYTEDLCVFPVRMTPGVNRGYREETLDGDWKLVNYTAACGPAIFRGTRLPASWVGDAFVCEPSANLVERFRFEGEGAARRAVRAHPNAAFLASRDERFRPVNLANGPDGALYVVDLYRGILQHRVFMTTFLRRQVLARGLDRPTGLGRIWRVFAPGAPGAPGEPAAPAAPTAPAALGAAAPGDLAGASWSELGSLLAHRNGWVRDRVHQVFVEEGRGERDALDVLLRVARGAPQASAAAEPAPSSALARVHALWALAALDQFDADVWLACLDAADPRVVRAAIATSETRLAIGDTRLTGKLVGLGRSGEPETRHQVLLSLGAGRQPSTEQAAALLLGEDASSADDRSAVMSGLAGRELEFLDLLGDWTDVEPGRATFLELLARATARQGVSERIGRLVDRTVQEPVPWRRAALLRGLLAGRPETPTGAPGRFALAQAPANVAWLSAQSAADPLAAELYGALAWPGRTDLPPEAVSRALSPAEERRFARGADIYAEVCAACHQASGRGEPGKAPPLRQSPWVLGSEERLARILLQGLTGPIEFGTERWNAEMPAWSASDEDLASILTYVRREWGHGAEPIDSARAGELRAGLPERPRPWTLPELEALP